MKTKIEAIRMTAFLIALLPFFAVAADTAEPTADDQVLLERINTARLHQADESRRLNLNFQEGMKYKVPANLQPLIWRSTLAAAAIDHNTDMWTRGYFEHVSPSGQTPLQQALAHDTDLLTVGQDLGAGRNFTTPDAIYSAWMIDAGVTDRDHRQCILHGAVDSFGSQRSSRSNSYYGVYWTAFFGVSLSHRPHVTGVIYRDLNRNGRYDAGEGQAHWKVRLVPLSPDAPAASQPISNTAAATAAPVETEFVNAYATGGYAIELPAEGAYTVEAVAPDGSSFYQETDAGDTNVKVDFAIEASSPAAAQTPASTGGSGKHAGCDLTTGRDQTAWTLLAGMGLMVIAMLGLRIGSRQA